MHSFTKQIPTSLFHVCLPLCLLHKPLKCSKNTISPFIEVTLYRIGSFTGACQNAEAGREEGIEGQEREGKVWYTPTKSSEICDVEEERREKEGMGSVQRVGNKR